MARYGLQAAHTSVNIISSFGHTICQECSVDCVCKPIQYLASKNICFTTLLYTYIYTPALLSVPAVSGIVAKSSAYKQCHSTEIYSTIMNNRKSSANVLSTPNHSSFFQQQQHRRVGGRHSLTSWYVEPAAFNPARTSLSTSPVIFEPLKR